MVSKLAIEWGPRSSWNGFIALLAEILIKLDIKSKPVWEHVGFLLNTGEPKGHKEDAECIVPQGLHVTVYFDSICK